mgnify:CR=1 FL=1|tara:strand:+ start:1270 stop:2454 length:1185 start_codon:yes stop_codon:yes gene_type:complete
MLYYLLNQIKFTIKPENISVKFFQKQNGIELFASKSLSFYLNKVKHQISQYNNWDNIKKYTNPYEFIHTNIPHVNYSISKYKPISRAFFKIVEIYNAFDLLNSKHPIKTYHLAEGPGGFIEATAYLRKNKFDEYYGMTLIEKKNQNVPGWKKSENFLKKHKNVTIEYGFTKNGDLYHPDNFKYCFQKHRGKFDILTADGGFDFSHDFNNQEDQAFRLIFTQTIYAIAMQKKGGSFVLKIYDCFLLSTNQLIYLLSCFYNNVYISKPNTSRHANSEKYVICTDFKISDTTIISYKFHKVLTVLNNIDFNIYSIYKIINLPIDLYFKNHIEEINAIFGQQQIENIINTTKIVTFREKKNDKLNQNKNINIQKCINWCIQNNIPYNKFSQPTNIFLT